MIGKRLLTTMAMMGLVALGIACTGASDLKPTPATSGGSPDAGPTTGGTGAPAPGTSSVDSAGFTTSAAQPSAYGIQPFAAQQQAGIWVSGSGLVVVIPDLALLSLGVDARADTVQQARDDAATAMDKVMAVLKGSGIQEKDIKTQYFNIQPEYVWNDFARRQEITGYRVTNNISVRVRDLEGLGALIDRVADAGGNLVRVDGISFTTEEPEKYSAQAREAAVKDAMSKAQQFANLTGVTLGKLVYIAESGGNIPIVRDYAEAKVFMAGADVPSTPITPGEMELTISVQAVFGIE